MELLSDSLNRRNRSNIEESAELNRIATYNVGVVSFRLGKYLLASQYFEALPIAYKDTQYFLAEILEKNLASRPSLNIKEQLEPSRKCSIGSSILDGESVTPTIIDYGEGRCSFRY